MKRLLSAILLGAVSNVHAGTWTVGLDAGPSRLDSRHHDDADVDTRPALALRGAYWFTPNFALEGELLHAETSYRTRFVDSDRDMTSFLIGGRAQASIGERSFVYLRGGYAHHWIDTVEPRVAIIDDHTSSITFVEDDTDAGHYLGVGFGWRWSERWSSNVEVARLYGDVAYGCNEAVGDCSTTHSSYFDLVTFGVAYDFD